eukprot:2851547-Rhodomonas_salina.1
MISSNNFTPRGACASDSTALEGSNRGPGTGSQALRYTQVRRLIINGSRVPGYPGTRVPWYLGTRVGGAERAE